MVGADPDGKAGLMSPIYSWTVGVTAISRLLIAALVLLSPVIRTASASKTPHTMRVVIDNDCERGTTLVARLPLGKDAG
jgi:hypothetical protein